MPMRPATHSLLRAAFVASLVLPFSRAAASPVEELVQVETHPDIPDVIVGRYEQGGGGLLVSRDAGRTFQLLCSAQVNPAQAEQKDPVHLAGDGTMFVRGFDGLWRDDGQSCGFQREGMFEGKWVSDMTVDPTDPRRLFAVTSGVEGDARHGLYLRDAEGSWSVVGNHEPKLVIHRVEAVARAGSGLRIYQSIARLPASGDLTQLAHFVRHTDDHGGHWTEHAVTGGADAPMLEVVDSTDPDRVLLVQQRQGDKDQLFVSSDRGKTLVPYLEVTHFAGAAQADDGRIWIADAGDVAVAKEPAGLWAANSLAEAPRLVDPRATTCLKYHRKKQAVLACRRDELGEVSIEGHQYLARVSLNSVQSFVRCEGEDAIAQCADQMCNAYCGPTHFPNAAICLDLHHFTECVHGDPVRPDAGAEEPDAGAPPVEEPKKKKGGKCSVAGAGLRGAGGELLLAFVALLAGGLWLRRQRARALGVACLALAACGEDPAPSHDDAHDAGADASFAPVRCGDDVPAFALPMAAMGAEQKLSAAVLAATPAPPEKYLNDWTLELRDAQGKPVSDAEITMARPFMPAHGHDGTFAPTVEAGDAPGQFVVNDLNLWMRGPWEIQLRVTSPTLGDDYIVFQVCVEE
jgi:hypothetical protein